MNVNGNCNRNNIIVERSGLFLGEYEKRLSRDGHYDDIIRVLSLKVALRNSVLYNNLKATKYAS